MFERRTEHTIDIVKEELNSKSPIIAVQCIHVEHLRTFESNIPDRNLVRLKLYHEDGVESNRTEVWNNYERPFYITKLENRTHTQHKNREHVSKLNCYWSTDSALLYRVKRLLQRPKAYGFGAINEDFPYIYGIDITAATMIKHEINAKLPDDFIPNLSTTTAYDTESDIARTGDNNNPEIITVASGRHRHATIFIMPFYTENYDPELFKKYQEEHLPGWTIDVVSSDNYTDQITRSFDKVNEYNNDMCVIWNIGYDIPHIEKSLEREGKVTIAEAMHGIGEEQASSFWYNPGPTTRRTITGKVVHKSFHEIYNAVNDTSVSKWIDLMFVCAKKRAGTQAIAGGYSVDNVLNKLIGKGKLKLVPEYEKLSGLDWHIQMQLNKPTEYMIYALYDVIGLIEYGDQEKDVEEWLQPNDSDINRMGSGKQAYDVFYYTNLEDGYINGPLVINKETADREDELFNLADWIAIAPSYLYNGVKLTHKYFNRIVDTLTNSITCFVQDNDLLSAYPNQIIATNASLETTIIELTEDQPALSQYTVTQRRKALMNRCAGVTGQYEVGCIYLNLPDWDEVDTYIDKHLDESNIKGDINEGKTNIHSNRMHD